MGGQWRVVAAGPWDDPGWQHALEDAGCEVVLGRSFERFPGQAYTEGELIDLFKDADAVLEAKNFSYQRGETALLELLDAQRTANEIRSNFNESLAEQAKALIELERAAQLWEIHF